MATTILVADDSRTMQEVFRMVLEPEGYDLVSAHTGATALRKAREIRPDAVVVDLNMPDGNGRWLIDQLRADDALAKVPVLLTFPNTKPLSDKVCKAIGANEGLGKPFHSATLLEKVEAMVGKPATTAASAATPAPQASPEISDRISRIEKILGQVSGGQAPDPARDTMPFQTPRDLVQASVREPSRQHAAHRPPRPAPQPSPKGPASQGPVTRDDILDAVRQVAQEVVERAIWELVPDIAERIIWEVVPQITETLVKERLDERGS